MEKTTKSVQALERVKDAMVLQSNIAVRNGRPLLSEQWVDLLSIAGEIMEACQGKDLGAVAAGTRRMKNKLRKRQFRKRLEALESDDEEKKDQKQGECLCSNCGAKLDVGGGKKCADGALCPKCALNGKVKDDDDKKPTSKKSGTKEESCASILRRRRY